MTQKISEGLKWTVQRDQSGWSERTVNGRSVKVDVLKYESGGPKSSKLTVFRHYSGRFKVGCTRSGQPKTAKPTIVKAQFFMIEKVVFNIFIVLKIEISTENSRKTAF